MYNCICFIEWRKIWKNYLYIVGYEKYDEYNETLNSLLLDNSNDDIFIDLKVRDYKDAMLHLYALIDTYHLDLIRFGRQLMIQIKSIYEESDLVEFGNKMYDLWNHLPNTISYKEPFYTLSYADDCLSYGNKKQCCELYEKAFHYYDFVL